MIDKWLELVSSVYFPTRLTVVDNQFGNYSIYSSKDLMKVIRDEAQNPYISLFRERFIPSIVNDRPDLIGVSITATSQIIPGLTLCRLIKEAAPDLHLTIGGSIFTRLVDNIRRCPSLFDLTDDIMVFEGETALLELVNQIGREERFQQGAEPDLSPEREDHGQSTLLLGKYEPVAGAELRRVPARQVSVAGTGAAGPVFARVLLQGLRILRPDARSPEFQAERAGPDH